MPILSFLQQPSDELVLQGYSVPWSTAVYFDSLHIRNGEKRGEAEKEKRKRTDKWRGAPRESEYHGHGTCTNKV